MESQTGREIAESAREGDGGYPSLRRLIGRKRIQAQDCLPKESAVRTTGDSVPKFPKWYGDQSR